MELKMLIFNIFFSLLIISTEVQSDQECIPRKLAENKIVCVCNSTYCDSYDPITTIPSGQYLTYVTNRDGLRLKKTVGNLDSNANNGAHVLTIDNSITYQTIVGFGGSFTDAVGINYFALSESTRAKLMSSYFSKTGSEYSFCKVAIGGTDFSTHGYTYDDTANDVPDPTLSNFALAQEDHTYNIPLIKLAQNLTGYNLKLYASSWTAPKWMKTTKAYAGLFGFIEEQYYQAWADYHLKFFEAYEKENITFWGVSTGNEPSLAYQANNLIPVNLMGPWDKVKWIANNLGPTIKQSKFSYIKIVGVEDQIYNFPFIPQLLMQNATVKKYMDGFGVHWYFNFRLGRDYLTRTHDAIPDKFVINTEACEGTFLSDTQGLDVGSWLRGENYANDIIEDFNRYVSGWIDWNMALNTQGGPTFIANYVDSPIIVNAAADEFYKSPMYYSMTHFSKFVPSGSVRINLKEVPQKGLNCIAFRRPDNAIVVVIQNRNGNDTTVTIENVSRNGKINLNVGAFSLTTAIYNSN